MSAMLFTAICKYSQKTKVMEKVVQQGRIQRFSTKPIQTDHLTGQWTDGWTRNPRRYLTRPYTRHKMRPRPALRHFQRFLQKR